MQKVTNILIIVILLSGCSVSRVRSPGVNNNERPDNEKYINTLREQNLTNTDFFIQKSEIELIGNAGTEKFIATVKYKSHNEYLISIRSRTGIEAARIYINNDTVQVNDRINRKLYCISINYIKEKYGITLSMLPIIFGDFVGSLPDNNLINCLNKKLNVSTDLNGLKLDYIIDCEKRKALESRRNTDENSEEISLVYDDFFRSGDRWIPGSIEIFNLESDSEVVIRILKVDTEWNDFIEFIPGNRYDIINLL